MDVNNEVDISQRYQASMVLTGVGDALGYYHGRWEFCHSGETIHKELEKLGGLSKIALALPAWNLSDDTVMSLATAEALMKWGRKSADNDRTRLFKLLAQKYISCMDDMGGRAPGMTCMSALRFLGSSYQIPFNPRGGGCGAAMRAMCIGLRFPRPEDIDDLVAVGIESGRMTHHHPTGYLGSFTAALFVSYALQGKPLRSWGASMLNELPRCLEYITKSGHFVEENTRAMQNGYFRDAWKRYLKLRGISDGTSEPSFPNDYGVKERDVFVKSVSFDGWGGASGHDAPMIAYDALLGCGNDWTELCSRSMFHCGDSDSTGVIAAACYGAMNGFNGVPENLYRHLEYRDRLIKAGEVLYLLSQTNADISSANVDAKAEPESPGPPPDTENLDQLKLIASEIQDQAVVESSQNMDTDASPQVSESQTTATADDSQGSDKATS
ncbi:protein ADP-ribosylarginine hydrolase-like [Pecten maximus]|uniref:protein ADP-ribosylarginine hydrolase-like n=1 Tax=Pecten maximus TaxID=6579 RepID=UPI001458095E|nr:protein ADP-ribosylarginine hydrolase-like [Pecten maximus]XP_033754164.1 protein ADP-ribosylarginine hydrolase-like [Pecten maximus]XP_033754175.1 protein ADP-ribosylarginine hydrolase-like [Pecten maximus]